MAKILLHPVGTLLDQVVSEAERARNLQRQEGLDAELAEKVAVVHDGWGERAKKRVHEKGKWTTWERIEHLKDPGTEVFEVGTLVNWGRSFAGSKRPAPGAGVVTCFARVQQRWCIDIANEKMATINHAYDRVEKERSLS